MITPLRGKLLGQVIPEDTKIGSIHLAKTKKEYPKRVKILSTGDRQLNSKGKEVPFRAAIGQVAYIKRGAGQHFEYEGEKLVILYNEDIIGKA